MNSDYKLHASQRLTIPVVDCSLWITIFFENAEGASKRPSREYLALEFCELLEHYEQTRKLVFPYLATSVVRLGPFKGTSYHDLVRAVAGDILGRVFTLDPRNGDFGGNAERIAKGIKRSCYSTTATKIMKELEFGVQFREFDLAIELIHEDVTYQRIAKPHTGIGNSLPITPWEPGEDFWRRHREHWEGVANGAENRSKGRGSDTTQLEPANENACFLTKEDEETIAAKLNEGWKLREIAEHVIGKKGTKIAILNSKSGIEYLRKMRRDGMDRAMMSNRLAIDGSLISKACKANRIKFEGRGKGLRNLNNSRS